MPVMNTSAPATPASTRSAMSAANPEAGAVASRVTTTATVPPTKAARRPMRALTAGVTIAPAR